jgi:hypothetical protein
MACGVALRSNLLCMSWTGARGRVFLVDLDARRVVSFFEFSGPDGGYADAAGVALAPDWSILVADTRNDVVRRFTPFGKQVASYGEAPSRPPGAAGRDRPGSLDRPRSLALHDGVVLVGCGEGCLRRGVQRFTLAGQPLPPLRSRGDVEAEFGAPRGLWAGRSGILVADTLHGVVQRFDSGARYVGEVRTAARAGETSRPVGVVELVNGDLLIVDEGDRRGLRRLNLFGDVLPDAGGFAALQDPQALAADEQGRIYVLDRDGERVQRLGADLRFDVTLLDLAETLYGS